MPEIAIPAAPESFDYGQAFENALASALEPICELEKVKHKPFITPKEVEALYGISRATLKAWRKDGKGPKCRQPDRNGPVWYTHEDMRAFFMQKSGGAPMSYAENSILTLKELAEELRLDPRTVKQVASELGGRRIGNRWRFRWGTVMESFNDAHVTQRQRQRLVGQGDGERQAGGLQDVPARQERRSGMAGRKTMGGRTETISAAEQVIPTDLERLMSWGNEYLDHAGVP